MNYGEPSQQKPEMELEQDILHRILYNGAFAHCANWLVK
jgi:hypothetical protein